MKVLGVKCAKDKLMWALVEGASRQDAVVSGHATVSAPVGDRGDQLVWVRREVFELLDRWTPDAVAVRVADPGGLGNSLPRAEVDGVVQEAVAARGVLCRRLYSASLRAAFSAKNGPELQSAFSVVPATASTPASRLDPVAAAVSALPVERS